VTLGLRETDGVVALEKGVVPGLSDVSRRHAQGPWSVNRRGEIVDTKEVATEGGLTNGDTGGACRAEAIPPRSQSLVKPQRVVYEAS